VANQKLTSEEQANLREAGKNEAERYLRDHPNRWNDAQINIYRGRVLLGRLKLRGGSEAAEVFVKGYNQVAELYEAKFQRLSLPEGIRSASEFAEEHNMNPSSMDQLCKAGLVPGARKIGPTWLFTEDAGIVGLEAYRRRNETRPQAAPEGIAI
jgi:hypothetical protein